MSFVAAFYNFTLDLHHADRGIFTRKRVKTALLLHEPLAHLYARMIAFAHCYREGQSFSHGLSEPKEPTIWHKDVLEETLLWVELGSPSKQKIERSLHASPRAEHRIYFYETDQITKFCHMLRGSKTNWVRDIEFFMIDPALLAQLIPLERTSPAWDLTFIDNRLYLTCDGTQLEADIAVLDIWANYQDSLAT